uniref:Uncharacterized protein n=1 Tax=Anguilla anguilla TaxID=7936 RepID=A0A0E9R8Z3_ANGAN
MDTPFVTLLRFGPQTALRASGKLTSRH